MVGHIGVLDEFPEQLKAPQRYQGLRPGRAMVEASPAAQTYTFNAGRGIS
jgi:hypothetical protein